MAERPDSEERLRRRAAALVEPQRRARNAFAVVEQFERRVAEFTGAPYAVAVDSCTNALFLCCTWLKVDAVTLPCRTYCSVPMAVIHAGARVRFEDRAWSGCYQLRPFPIWDAAKRFRLGMFLEVPKPPHESAFVCLSFHSKKALPIGRGGMILTDDAAAVDWFRMARRDGRADHGEPGWQAEMIGWNCYLTPEQAARGLTLLDVMPNPRPPDQQEEYPDLREWRVFRDGMKGVA